MLTVESALILWADWIKNSRTVNGYPSESVGFVVGASNCWNDFEHECDVWTCEAVEASIDDLEAIYARALYHHYLDELFLFAKDKYEQVLKTAHILVKLNLQKRNIQLQ